MNIRPQYGLKYVPFLMNFSITLIPCYDYQIEFKIVGPVTNVVFGYNFNFKIKGKRFYPTIRRLACTCREICNQHETNTLFSGKGPKFEPTRTSDWFKFGTLPRKYRTLFVHT